MFGDSKLCACKTISEEDLAAFIADCIYYEDKANKVLPIGGPLEKGEMLFRLLGREPKFIKVPIQIMDAVIWVLDGPSCSRAWRTPPSSARLAGTMPRRACCCGIRNRTQQGHRVLTAGCPLAYASVEGIVDSGVGGGI